MKKLIISLALPALLAVLLFVSSTNLLAGSQLQNEVGITERLDEYIPDDVFLFDIHGNLVNLKKLIDKPTVINFVYFRCPGICSPLMNGLSDAINHSELELGKDYQVVTISFDAREGYDLAGKKKNTYVQKMKYPSDSLGWMFLTGDSVNIDRITKATGFGFKMIGTEFQHEGALIMVSPDGKITRYLKGLSFLPFEFKLAILEASRGKSSPTINKVIQFCYSFDSGSQRYVLDITKISAIIIIFFAVSLLIYLLIKSRWKKAKGGDGVIDGN